MPGYPTRRRALLPAWAAIFVLLLLLTFVLVRNSQHDRRPQIQDTSELIQKEQSAVAETKAAFSEIYAQKSLRAALVVDENNDGSPTSNIAAGSRPPSSMESGKERAQQRGGAMPRRPAAAPNDVPTSRQNSGRRHVNWSGAVGDGLVDAAIGDWRSVTGLRAGRAGAWRRLGITLFLFNRSGGMTAFRHILNLPLKEPVPASKAGVLSSRRDRLVAPPASDLPRSEEMALWETLYGPSAPRREDAGALRAKLTRLKLGWFEDIAAAQLYNRAGMVAEAERASRRAHVSADSIRDLLTFEGWLRIIGSILLLGAFVSWLVRSAANAAGNGPVRPAAMRPAYVDGCYAPPVLNVAPSRPDVPRSEAIPAASASVLSYRARMIGFVVYFGSYLLIAWPLQFIGPLISHWSDQSALRLNMAIDLLAYIPITAVTLLALKKLATAEQHRPISWQETLRGVGFRTDGIGRDAAGAVVAFAMVTPVLLLASVVSRVLFRNFHTPVHPVDLIILNTQDGFIRTMLVLQACVGAPIVEEMTFRGLLFQGLRERWGFAIAATLSSAVFALSHNTLPGGFLTLWALGFSFSIVCSRSRSIFPNILMHAINNGLVVITVFATASQ